MYEDEDYEETTRVEPDEEQELTFKLNIGYNSGAAIESAIKEVVKQKVSKKIDKLINVAIEKSIEEKVASIVSDGMATKFKSYNYDGSVKSEASLTDLIMKSIEGIANEGLNYKITTIDDSFSRNRSQSSIAELIQVDLKRQITATLKPQFDTITKEFQSKTKEALRAFAIAAVDDANQKTLRGY